VVVGEIVVAAQLIDGWLCPVVCSLGSAAVKPKRGSHCCSHPSFFFVSFFLGIVYCMKLAYPDRV